MSDLKEIRRKRGPMTWPDLAYSVHILIMNKLFLDREQRQFTTDTVQVLVIRNYLLKESSSGQPPFIQALQEIDLICSISI